MDMQHMRSDGVRATDQRSRHDACGAGDHADLDSIRLTQGLAQLFGNQLPKRLFLRTGRVLFGPWFQRLGQARTTHG